VTAFGVEDKVENATLKVEANDAKMTLATAATSMACPSPERSR
jgi:hypothetical protein